MFLHGGYFLCVDNIMLANRNKICYDRTNSDILRGGQYEKKHFDFCNELVYNWLVRLRAEQC